MIKNKMNGGNRQLISHPKLLTSNQSGLVRQNTQNNLYNVLGLSPGASQENIKRAYINLAKRYHPNKGGNANEFRRITNARNKLLQKS